MSARKWIVVLALLAPGVVLAAGDEEELPEVDLDAWSGILLGGGPWNTSDAQETKSPAQVAAE